MVEFKESKFYKLLQDFFINNDKETFIQFLAEFYNRTEGIIIKNDTQDELIKELREMFLLFNEEGIDENIVREKVNYFVENNEKIQDIITKIIKNTNNIKNITSQLDKFMYSRFKGKKIVFLGDSITVGFVDKPFANLVAENMGMTLTNLAVSGSHVTYENDEVVKSVFVQRGDIPTDADLICIAGGTNDFGHNKPIGISSSNNFYDFYGAYKIMIDWIQQNRPDATLFCMTPLHRENDSKENTLGYVLEDYVNVIRDVCEDRGVPVLDLFSRSGLNPNIEAHKSNFATDGLHPNQIIHDRLGNHIIPNFIRGL